MMMMVNLPKGVSEYFRMLIILLTMLTYFKNQTSRKRNYKFSLLLCSAKYLLVKKLHCHRSHEVSHQPRNIIHYLERIIHLFQ